MADIADPERRLALAYAPADARAALTTLFALDERLAGIVSRATEPTIGLMRLVWWRDALERLDAGAPPAEPLLIEAATLRERGAGGAVLAEMTAGWEALLDDPALEPATVDTHAAERGARLFRLAAMILGAPGEAFADGVAAAGAGWARVDLARHTRDPAVSERSLRSAGPDLKAAPDRWPRGLRPLGQLAILARNDAERGIGRLARPGSPARLLRILAFHSFGR
jgi:phytoene synthase